WHQCHPVHGRAPHVAAVLLLQPRAQGHARRARAHGDRVPDGVVRRRLRLHGDVAPVAADRPFPVPHQRLARDEVSSPPAGAREGPERTIAGAPALVLWCDVAHDAPFNMARDEALLARVAGGAGDTVLRVFAFEPPGITLGRSQDPARELDLERLARAGVRW